MQTMKYNVICLVAVPIIMQFSSLSNLNTLQMLTLLIFESFLILFFFNKEMHGATK